ncbi:hypothetical protein BCR42DRAFT_435374 [Absidia repens]|uniref:Uncharacterized protein n=1 Tax=Absidia repens TaxID=90262 RepID=A0A1X2INA8_9FUNG|nr:hypothetical protein BCR42DRAFT_435374 [Absidia repens]
MFRVAAGIPIAIPFIALATKLPAYYQYEFRQATASQVSRAITEIFVSSRTFVPSATTRPIFNPIFQLDSHYHHSSVGTWRKWGIPTSSSSSSSSENDCQVPSTTHCFFYRHRPPRSPSAPLSGYAHREDRPSSSSCSPPWPRTLDHANSNLSSSVPADTNNSPLIYCIDDKPHYYPHHDYHGPQSSTTTYFLPSTPTTGATTPSSSSTTSCRHSTYHHRHPSLRYHPYSKHSTITNDNNNYNTASSSSSTPSYTSSPSLSSSSSLFSTLLPDQTLSPASSVSSSLIDHALLSSTDDSHAPLSSFALFGTLSSSSATQYDDYHNNNIYHHQQHQQDTRETDQDLGDIMDDDDIFNDFAQLAPPTTAASRLIQSPPISPLLLPQDLAGTDDFLLF